MSTADDKQRRLETDARELLKFYRAQRISSPITIFAEDFDWLLKREAIKEYEAYEGLWLDKDIPVRRGDRKRKVRKKRPPEFAFF